MMRKILRKSNNRKSQNRNSNRKQQNRNSNRRQQNRRQNGGDGQMGHTVMTESYLGRPAIGFGPVANSPQTPAEVEAMRVPHTVTGGGRVESAGHWNQAPTGWENAPSHCSVELKGDVKLGGGRRRSNNRRNNNRSNNRSNNRNNNRNNNRSNNRSNNRRSNNRRSNNRRSNNRRNNNRK